MTPNSSSFAGMALPDLRGRVALVTGAALRRNWSAIEYASTPSHPV